MKPYLGEIIGNGGRTSRSGTLGGGLVVKAHSRQGSVLVQLVECAGITHAKVWLTANPKTGKGFDRLLYHGPVAGTETPDVVMRLPSRAVRQVIMPDPEMLSAEIPAYRYTPDQEDEPRSGVTVIPPAQATRMLVDSFKLPPPQRRTQPAAPIVRAIALDLAGSLDPTGDEMVDEPQDYDCNEGYDPEPRRPRGKLTLLRSVDD